MRKFQKRAIILGIIYLIFANIHWFFNRLLGSELSNDLSVNIFKQAPYVLATLCITLLLVFNALQNKTAFAKTASGVSITGLLLLICSVILTNMELYYLNCGFGGYDFALMLSPISITSTIFSSISIIISIGFFAASLRQNKAVLLSSIVWILVKIFCDLDWLLISPNVDALDTVWIAGMYVDLYSIYTNLHLDIMNSIAYMLSSCALFISTITIKSAK